MAKEVKTRKPRVKKTENVELKGVKEETKVKGVGDVIKKVTEVLGIEQCEPCKERQEKLNKMFPFTKKANPIPKSDFEFILGIKNTILKEDRARFEQLVRDTFKVKFISCNCPVKYKKALEDLKIQVNYQKAIEVNDKDL